MKKEGNQKSKIFSHSEEKSLLLGSLGAFTGTLSLGLMASFSLGLLTSLSSCTNTFQQRILVASPTPSASPEPVVAKQLVIASANISAQSGVSSTTVYFDSTNSPAAVSNYCGASLPCNCEYTWTQGTTAVPIPHKVVSSLTNVQPYLLSCNAPDIYPEIPDGTKIKLTVVAAPTNAVSGTFSIPSYTITKGQGVTGDFLDGEGHSFYNISRYSCYGMFKRGSAIQSKSFASSTNGDPLLVGTQFCVSTIAGGTLDPSTCPNPSVIDYSSQNYYYNLYITTNNIGNINAFNTGFYCPTVKEALVSDGTVGSQNKFWPLDSTFALATSSTGTFNVGVSAHTRLGVAGDPSSINTSCQVSQDGSEGTPNPGGLVQSCLGFAAKPKSDGTCAAIKNLSGDTLPTYRLRKYVALYPRVFDTNGAPIAQPQSLDTVYVLDRPVNGPQTGTTMLGPKPCPMSYFDKKSVVNTAPRYVAANDPGWIGKNIDGIEFPNEDIRYKSCSTTFPILDNANRFTLKTINRYNANASSQHVYVRPIQQPYLAHYEEDTSFEACAPQSTSFKDPPLHFSRLSLTGDAADGNVAWCAEVYPSQNDNVQSLDPPTANVASGLIAPFTSHTQKNSASSACTASQVTIPNIAGAYTYPSGGSCTASVPCWARHPTTSLSTLTGDAALASATCDRTAGSSSTAGTATQWPRFPLLAPAKNIEDQVYGIAADKSYHCTITYDNSLGKTGIRTPSDGCCIGSSVAVRTGVGSSTPSVAHLEPDVECGIPIY